MKNNGYAPCPKCGEKSALKEILKESTVLREMGPSMAPVDLLNYRESLYECSEHGEFEIDEYEPLTDANGNEIFNVPWWV